MIASIAVRGIQLLICLMAGALAHGCSGPAIRAPSPNGLTLEDEVTARLIATMPSNVESVVVWRLDKLTQGQHVFAASQRNSLDLAARSAEEHATSDIDELVRWHAAYAGARLYSEGGSEFTAPSAERRGGGFNRRAIWVTRDPIAKLTSVLQRHEYWKLRTKVTDLADSQIAYQILNKKVGEADTWLAMPEPNVVILTEDRGELESMLAKWNKNADEMPERWRSLLGDLDPSSPILLLRQYSMTATDLSPNDQRARDAFDLMESYSIAVALADQSQLRFEVLYKGERPEAAIGYFQQVLPSFVWILNSDDRSLRGDAFLAPALREGIDEERAALIELQFVNYLFGRFWSI